MELTYTKVGDYYIPDLTFGDQPPDAQIDVGSKEKKCVAYAVVLG